MTRLRGKRWSIKGVPVSGFCDGNAGGENKFWTWPWMAWLKKTGVNCGRQISFPMATERSTTRILESHRMGLGDVVGGDFEWMSSSETMIKNKEKEEWVVRPDTLRFT